MDYCKAHGISILAYSPLAQGLLTGRFKRGHSFERGDHRKRNLLFKPHLEKAVHQSLSKLEMLASSKHCSMAQLALAWLLSKPSVFPVVGSRNPEQTIDNAQSVQIRLSDEDIESLNTASDAVIQHLDQNPILWR